MNGGTGTERSYKKRRVQINNKVRNTRGTTKALLTNNQRNRFLAKIILNIFIVNNSNQKSF